MRKLLKLLTVLTVAAPAIVNTTACSKTSTSIPNLNSVTQLTGLNLKSDANQTFSQLNDRIANANEFKNQPLATGYIMTYFNSSNDIISNDTQNIGTFYVQIKAASGDPNWTGTSPKLLFTLHTATSRDLNTVTSLTGLSISANANNTFNDLRSTIAAANEFSGSNPSLDNGFIMNFYQASSGGNNINSSKQPAAGGTFFVEIIASQDDVNWFGQTTRLSFVISGQGKVDLNGLQNNATVTGVAQGNVSAFQTALVNVLKQEAGFNALTLGDVDITRNGGGALASGDIVTNAALAITVTAKAGSASFEGSKDITVNLTTVDNRTDLNGLSTAANVTGVTQGDVSGFQNALVTVLKGQAGFSALTLGDVDITKNGGGALAAGDIVTNPSLAITVTAKASSANFKGSKNITVNLTTAVAKTDLNGLSHNATVTGVTQGDVSGFQIALVNVLKQEAGFNALTVGDLDFTESGSSNPLVSGDIVTNTNVPVTVTAKAGSAGFTGHQDIAVNLTTVPAKTDLNGLAGTATVTGITQGDISAFQSALIVQLSQQSGFNSLTLGDVDITKGGGNNPLVAGDIVTNPSLSVRVTAKIGSANYTGFKDISVNLTVTAKTDLSTITALTVTYTVDSSKAWTDLDTAVKAAPQLSAHPLAAGGTINYYASAASSTPINTDLQSGTTIFVQIIADASDPNWSGQTGKIQVDITPNFKAATGDSEFTTLLASDPAGNVYAAGGGADVFKAVAGTHNFQQMTGTAGLNQVQGIATDKDGNIYIATFDGTVKKALAGSNDFSITMTNALSSIGTIATDKDGNIYIGNGNTATGEIKKALAGSTDFTVDYTGATGIIVAIAVDNSGNIYAASASGTIPAQRGAFKCASGNTTFTALTGLSTGSNYRSLAINSTGDVYVGGVDAGGGGNKVYKLTTGQTNFNDTGYAGGSPQGLAVDVSDNLYVAADNVYRLLKNDTVFYKRFGTTVLSLDSIIVANGIVYTSGVTGGSGEIYYGN